MNAQDLIDRVKLRLDDRITPRVFKDSDILIALNDAQSEFALRTLCIFESGSGLSITAQSPWIDLPEGTCWVVSAIAGTTPLRVITEHELEFGYFEINGVEQSARFSNWRSAKGVPAFLVTNLGVTQARLVPAPVDGGSLYVERYRLPAPMSLEVAPEIPTPYHPDLVIGALAYLLDVPDTETYNAQAAIFKRNEWEGRLVIAEQTLQTALRAPMRVVPAPPAMSFVQPIGNTNGVAPNDNTNN